MLQWIIASVIVAAALVWGVILLVKSLRRAASSGDNPCGGCSSDCSGCALPPAVREAAKERKRQLEKERKKNRTV